MQTRIFIKSKHGEQTCYTTLKELLKSEGLNHIYETVARKIRQGKEFDLGEITVKKVKLNHTKYRTK